MEQKLIGRMKKILNIFVIMLLAIVIFPYTVNASNIVTLNIENNDGKLKVSGIAESDVYAVAILVYSGDTLTYMQTCSSDDDYACELNKEFDNGTYTVKVADYNGGDYIVKDVTVVKATNPDTGDKIISSIVIGGISLISLFSGGLYLYKKTKLKH